jgi:peptidoglycan L-alanyl-D-glutamate endopeptidase CwlK
MSFNLSKRSLNRLNGVRSDMVETVKLAIKLTRVDFGVTCGLRTVEEQKKLVATGRSQTMNSKHIPQSDEYSHAVDLVAYQGSDVVWELNVYDEICDAMAAAAKETGASIKWGAAWSEGDIRAYKGSAEDAMNAYIDLRRSEGRRPFLDGPHFELMA